MDQSKQPADSHLLLIIIPVMLFAMAWIFWHFNAEALYLFAAKLCYYMLWPLSFIGAISRYRATILTDVLQLPDAGKVFEWLQYGMLWPSVLMALACLYLAFKGVRHPVVSMFKGALTPDALMRYQATVFSAIAPLIPIARSLHENKDPRWHEALHPQEFVRNLKMIGLDGKLDRAIAEKTLIQQLGRRICFHGIDPAGTVFTDRLNSYEKAVFALLAPLALKRKDGVDEYAALRDQLNYSADPKTQKPELPLAQKSFDTYRSDKRVLALAMRHPYSVTFLMELYALSKQSGRVTTAEFLGWLRPNQTGLYFALNTVGRRTPFAESTGAYAQWLFEKNCSKEKRVPILPCVVAGVIGLSEEWDIYCSGVDEESEEALWGTLSADNLESNGRLFNGVLSEYFTRSEQASAIRSAPGQETQFDETMQAQSQQFINQEASRIRAAMSGIIQSKQ